MVTSDPLRVPTTTNLVQWCHGAPGFTALLLTYAGDSSVIEDSEGRSENILGSSPAGAAILNTIIQETVKVIWQRGVLRKGCSICHGTAGNGYSFLSAYLHTKDETYLTKAVCFAEIILDLGVTECCSTSDHPLSLFGGLSGTVQFLMDVAIVLEAKSSGKDVFLLRNDLFDGMAVF